MLMSMPPPPKNRYTTISDTQSGAYYLTVHAVRALFSNRRARCLLESGSGHPPAALL